MVLFSGGRASPVMVEADEEPLDEKPLYVPGEIIVRFNPGVQRDNIEGFYQEYGVEEIEDLGRRGRGNDREEKVIWVPPHQDVEELIDVLNRDPRVKDATRNFIYTRDAIPNDPRFPELC